MVLVWLVSGCAAGPPAPDGLLDCPTADSYAGFGNPDLEVVGAPTRDDALEMALSPYQREHGGEVVVVGERIGSLVVDGREVIVAQATEAPAGGWIVATHQGCAGYES